jgi:hypothetical protein
MPARFPSNPHRIVWDYRGGESDVRVGATKKDSTADRAENYAAICDAIVAMLAEETGDEEFVTIREIAKIAAGASEKRVREIAREYPLPSPAVLGAGTSPHKYRYTEIREWAEQHWRARKSEFPASFAEAKKKLGQ